MKNRYIVFDVETPNSKNDRMSSIGITVVEALKIKEEYNYLINPEEPFDDFNIELTGISPDMVKDKATFGELWNTVSPVLTSGILIAHNAPFDMGVLAKCLEAYNINCGRIANYACTCMIARRFFPSLPNCRLNTISDYLNIKLDHHNALSDSHACAEILIHYLKNGVNIKNFMKQYDLKTKCNLK